MAAAMAREKAKQLNPVLKTDPGIQSSKDLFGNGIEWLFSFSLSLALSIVLSGMVPTSPSSLKEVTCVLSLQFESARRPGGSLPELEATRPRARYCSFAESMYAYAHVRSTTDPSGYGMNI
eukprot:1027440-Amorphochlora_amoeboformis.AAC.1